jgi:hypothetical protein
MVNDSTNAGIVVVVKLVIQELQLDTHKFSLFNEGK